MNVRRDQRCAWGSNMCTFFWNTACTPCRDELATSETPGVSTTSQRRGSRTCRCWGAPIEGGAAGHRNTSCPHRGHRKPRTSCAAELCSRCGGVKAQDSVQGSAWFCLVTERRPEVHKRRLEAPLQVNPMKVECRLRTSPQEGWCRPEALPCGDETWQ